jgi:hypothetical protein
MIPKHLITEAVIQSEFYANCNLIRLNCGLELPTTVGRLDCGLFTDDWINLIAIVECKLKLTEHTKNSWQIMRYKQIGVPVYGLDRMDSMSLAQKIKSQNYAGIPWDTARQLSNVIRRYSKQRASKRLPELHRWDD